MITQKLLRERFDYKDGQLIYKVITNRKIKFGSVAGNFNDQGYIVVQIDGKKHRVHRLIWIYHNGDIPNGLQIDHINNIRNDNRVENLRLATDTQNKYNRSKLKNNTSGFKGVHFFQNKWAATIRVNNKQKYLGRRDTKEAAYELYKAAAIKYHGEFSNY